MSESMYSVEKVAQILDCEPETAVERIKCGDIPGLKIGRSWVIPIEAFNLRMTELSLEDANARRQQRVALAGASKVIQKAQGKARRRVPPTFPSNP